MIGTIWLNIGFGALASIITFFTAFSGNVWLVSLERAGYAFILFFLAAFPIRWLVAKIMGSSTSHDEMTAPAEVVEEHVSSTAEEQDLAEDGGFTPLALGQIGRITPEYDPTTVSNVVRRLTDE
ncbi:hypothetical protein NDK47_12005 [Brevibacillus ruminantium]|uniref:Uncharacterized protein n=1 Tax=Brevibacillus ruminantium TaxID=2950604 RepID=A0ABY4WLC8_9BACL|nr:hypothetical protein [Brevibacillus ruminantium]USG67950.1 hypothetical protein NDK47_12005 [Brevibacillus ruminantium]